MNLQQMEYFQVSARCGSLTRAAEELYTTQPHVSMVIRSLEKELGVTLFVRRSSGISLSEEGEQIYSYVNNILKQSQMIRDICQEAAEPCLRIAVNPSSSLAFLAGDFFQEKMAEGMLLQYTECGIEEMMHLLLEKQYDCGLLFLPADKLSAFRYMIQRKHLSYVSLRTSDLVLHSGKKSPFYGRESVTPEELAEGSFIQLEDDFFAVEDLLQDVPAFRNGTLSLRKVIRTNSDHMMIRMLQRTELCNVGSYWIDGAFGKYDFSMTRIEGFENQVSFGYLMPDNRPLRPEAEAFIGEIRRKMHL